MASVLIIRCQDACKRYTQKELAGGQAKVVERGPRKEMLKKERESGNESWTKEQRAVGRKKEEERTHSTMNLPDATITLGVQTSREDNRTQKPVLAMRRLMAEYCRGPYSPEIDKFALVLRVGGEMQEFDFEGCERIRRNKKERYITLDLGFPSHRWKSATDDEIRRYILESVETGLLCFMRRLEKDKAHVDAAKLINDFSRVKELYMATPHA